MPDDQKPRDAADEDEKKSEGVEDYSRYNSLHSTLEAHGIKPVLW